LLGSSSEKEDEERASDNETKITLTIEKNNNQQCDDFNLEQEEQTVSKKRNLSSSDYKTRNYTNDNNTTCYKTIAKSNAVKMHHGTLKTTDTHFTCIIT